MSIMILFPECPLDVTLPALPEQVRCDVPSYCTAVECCLNIDVLKRGFNTILSLDACSNRLVIGIENLKLNVTLLNYKWGTLNLFCDMLVIYRLRYYR
jgi:hypothetical protein